MAEITTQHLWRIEVVTLAEDGSTVGVDNLQIVAHDSVEALNKASELRELAEDERFWSVTYQGKVQV